MEHEVLQAAMLGKKTCMVVFQKRPSVAADQNGNKFQGIVF